MVSARTRRPRALANLTATAGGIAGRVPSEVPPGMCGGCHLRSEGRRSALSSVARELQLTLLLRFSHLAAARHEASEFLEAHGVPSLCIEDVLVALTEAAVNAAVHSGVDTADLRLAMLDDHIRLTVAAQGRGFDASVVDLSRRPSLLSQGGRGFYLISCVMDAVEIDSTRGTTITMIKRLRPTDCFPRA